MKEDKQEEANKETERKEAANEGAKLRCKTCFKEIAPKLLCPGHGGGGGSNDDDDATSDKAEGKTSSGEDKSLTSSHDASEQPDEIISELGSEAPELESSFDSETIAKLIDKGLLSVDSDRESMTLTIKLLCEPSSLTEEESEEFKKFMDAIIKEFDEFKKENNLIDDCMKTIEDDEGSIISLRITMPTLALYDEFIQRLANNLVPTIPSQKPQEGNDVATEIDANKDMPEKDAQKSFAPSPFSTKPW